jgi:hypothetical protein
MESLPVMPHFLPHFYGSLHTVKAVEYVKRGGAMKEFIKGALLTAGVLALAMGVRIAAFVPLHGQNAAVAAESPVAAADTGCAVRQVKMPCFRQAGPESQDVPPVQRHGEPAEAAVPGTIAAQDARCAARQVKMPCFQHSDKRS